MKHGKFIPSNGGVNWSGLSGKLEPAASLELNVGASKYFKLGQYGYRFEGYKSSIMAMLLSEKWKLARFIISDGKGFTGDDEYGTLAKINPTIIVRGGEVGEKPSEVIRDTARSAVLGVALGVAGETSAIISGFSQALDTKDALDVINTATDITGKLSEISDDMEAPSGFKRFMDHRFNKRIIIDVDCYMSTRTSRYTAKIVDTELAEINFSQLATVVAGMP